jgi:dimethylargininase
VVERLDPTHDLPDSVFVEDAAVVLDELAVIARPGATSRQAESPTVAAALGRFRKIEQMSTPATLDGGDVLTLGRTIYVGISTRTNPEGARQLGDFTAPLGYTVRCIRVRECLHLKSAVTRLDDSVIVCNPEWVDPRAFDDCQVVFIDPEEAFAGNVLRVGAGLICAAAHARTASLLQRRGYDVRLVDVSELAKAEGGVTCCSLIVT